MPCCLPGTRWTGEAWTNSAKGTSSKNIYCSASDKRVFTQTREGDHWAATEREHMQQNNEASNHNGSNVKNSYERGKWFWKK